MATFFEAANGSKKKGKSGKTVTFFDAGPSDSGRLAEIKKILAEGDAQFQKQVARNAVIERTQADAARYGAQANTLLSRAALSLPQVNGFGDALKKVFVKAPVALTKAIAQPYQKVGGFIGDAVYADNYTQGVQNLDKEIRTLRTILQNETDPVKRNSLQEAINSASGVQQGLIQQTGGNLKNQSNRQLAGLGLEVGVDLGTLGLGSLLKAPLKIGAEKILGRAIPKVATALGGFGGTGALFGAATGMQENKDTAGIVKDALIGGAAGTALLGAGYLVSKSFGKLVNRARNKEEVVAFVEDDLQRDLTPEEVIEVEAKVDEIKGTNQLAKKSETAEESVKAAESGIIKSDEPTIKTEEVKSEVPKKEEAVPKKKSESNILTELNKFVDEESKMDVNLPTKSLKSANDKAIRQIEKDPKVAYNEAVYGGQVDGDSRSALQIAFIKNAIEKKDDEAIAKVGMAAAKHARKSGQEGAMFKLLYERDHTTRMLMDVARQKMANVETKYPKILQKVMREGGEDAVTTTIKEIKKRTPSISDAQTLINNLVCR